MTDALQQPNAPTSVAHYPPLDDEVALVDLPVTKVTLLEDRAQVERRGKVALKAGRGRLAIVDVAPVLQDVSLRGEIAAAGARVVDTRARRAMRVAREHQPADIAALEEKIEALARSFAEKAEDRSRLDERRQMLLEMVVRGLAEIPVDAGWGLVAQQSWHDTLEGLLDKSHALDDDALALYHEQQDLIADIRRLVDERASKDRPDARFVCRLEVDVDAEAAGELELVVEYTVPGALWRPLHRARLIEPAPGEEGSASLEVETLAAVWQNTGEAWTDAALWFSTARSSLGTEPPKLADDRLNARRKSDDVVIARREVKLNKASVGGGAGGPRPPAGVELPGVDDGGDIQNIKAPRPVTLPSDGRPNLVPLFRFTTSAEVERMAAPELDDKVFIRARATHAGERPLLAGPVELIRRSGAVGWSKVLFVAPGERFELGFGPDHGFRLTRKESSSERIDEIDHWHHKTTTVQLFVSNLAGVDRQVEIAERIPVSEIEHVRVAILEDQTVPLPEVSDDGICTWTLMAPARSHHRLHLSYRVSTAPGVNPA